MDFQTRNPHRSSFEAVICYFLCRCVIAKVAKQREHSLCLIHLSKKKKSPDACKQSGIHGLNCLWERKECVQALFMLVSSKNSSLSSSKKKPDENLQEENEIRADKEKVLCFALGYASRASRLALLEPLEYFWPDDSSLVACAQCCLYTFQFERPIGGMDNGMIYWRSAKKKKQNKMAGTSHGCLYGLIVVRPWDIARASVMLISFCFLTRVAFLMKQTQIVLFMDIGRVPQGKSLRMTMVP